MQATQQRPYSVFEQEIIGQRCSCLRRLLHVFLHGLGWCEFAVITRPVHCILHDRWLLVASK